MDIVDVHETGIQQIGIIGEQKGALRRRCIVLDREGVDPIGEHEQRTGKTAGDLPSWRSDVVEEVVSDQEPRAGGGRVVIAA